MILVFGTIDHPNMNKEEVNASKKLSGRLCLIELTAVAVLEILGTQRDATSAFLHWPPYCLGLIHQPK